MSAVAHQDQPRWSREAVLDAVKRIGGLHDLAKRLGLHFKGTSLRCPNAAAHGHGDKRPSASIGSEFWKCHVCDAGGSALDLVMVSQDLDFKDALEWLALDLNVDPIGNTAPPGRRPQAVAPRPVVPPPPAVVPPAPDGDAAELAREVWRLVAPLELTPEAVSYLRGRHIEPWAVHATGARDWFPVRHELARVLRGFPEDVKVAAGFYTADKPAAEAGWSALVRLVRGGDRGLFVPVMMPGADFPVAYRWRTMSREARVKAMSMPGRRPSAYGLALPDALTSPLRAAAGHELVVIIEGEPDWWTLAGALGPHAGCVTLTAKSSGWPEWITEHLDAARRVVLVTHEPRPKAEAEGAAAGAAGRPVDKLVVGLHASMTARRGRAAADAAVYVLRADEEADWNDYARTGRLAERLAHLEPVVRATMPALSEDGWTRQ